MYCHFISIANQSGRFRCERCGIPSSRNKTYGPEGPPLRHCLTLPEPRSAQEVREIIDVLCPYCPSEDYHAADKTCHGTACKHGTPVARIALRGNCPKTHW